MSAFALYLLLAKATLLSFSGFGSLAQVRDDLVIQRGVLTDEALNRAVLVGRTTPGPMGVYLVSVGYEVAGVRGAIAGWLAVATPALLIMPIMMLTSRMINHPRIRGALDAMILASAVLIVLAGVPLMRDVWSQWSALVGV